MEWKERAFALLRRGIDEGLMPGAAACIGCRGQMLAAESLGMAALHPEPVPATRQTRYDMASLTKVMATTMVALRFIDDGRITLHDPISRWFDAPPDKRDVTVLQLMTHTAGFPPHIPLWTRLTDQADTLPLLLDTPPAYPAGTRVAYSCMGYILLGFLLERVGGAPLDQLARTWVFDPLGMRDTGFIHNAAVTEREVGSAAYASTEWDDDSGTWLNGIVHDENARFLGGVSGNAGLFSTLADCGRFASMLACRGVCDGARFLSEPLFRLASKNHTPGLEESRGLGLGLFDGRILSCGELFSPGSYGHSGYTGTTIWVDADSGLHVTLLTNSVHFGRERDEFFRLRRRFHNLVMAGWRSGT